MRLFPHRYIQVKLPGNQRKLYAFRCRDASVGDLVAVETARYPGVVQTVPVIKLGRNLYLGRTKAARRIPE